ncbi:MAG: Sb-PDE family phosphodiesterase [Pseudomonadales bacterium]
MTDRHQWIRKHQLWLKTLPLLLVPMMVSAHGPARAPDAGERAIVFPDTAEYKTLTVDLHTHSVFSDGHVWPKIRVEEALRDGLDAIAITEHLEYQPHRYDIEHADRNRAAAIAAQAASDTDLMVINGSEITREAPAGHMNAVFITDANKLLNVSEPPPNTADADPRDYYLAAGKWPTQAAVDAAVAQGAFVFWNHPYWTRQQPDGIARINDFHANNARAGKLHGIEIANGQDYSAEAHQIALDHDLTLIGVSDVHDLIDWDHPPTEGQHRPVTLVLATERSPAALREALFAKRTLVWFRNLLIGREAELTAMLEASISITSARYRRDDQVLELDISNQSDARFLLRNTSSMTFMHHADLIEIAPNEVTRLAVKPGAVLNEITLPFVVENALLAPEAHPTITLRSSISAHE